MLGFRPKAKAEKPLSLDPAPIGRSESYPTMTLKNRVGAFCMLCGGFALIIFWGSINTPDKQYDLPALLAGAALMAMGWVLRTSKPKANPADPPPVAKKRGLLASLFRRPPPPPPPPAPAPPPAQNTSGRGGLFRSKPKKL